MKKNTLLLLAVVALASCHKDIRSAISNSSYSTRSDITVTTSYLVLSNYAYTWDSSGEARKIVKSIPVNLESMPGTEDNISVVVVDQNGKLFDPRKGEVVSRDNEIKLFEGKLDPADKSDGKFNYNYSGKVSYYTGLQDRRPNEIISTNRLYYKVPGSVTREGKDIYIGFSIYLEKRGSYQVVLVAPASHV